MFDFSHLVKFVDNFDLCGAIFLRLERVKANYRVDTGTKTSILKKILKVETDG